MDTEASHPSPEAESLENSEHRPTPEQRPAAAPSPPPTDSGPWAKLGQVAGIVGGIAGLMAIPIAILSSSADVRTEQARLAERMQALEARVERMDELVSRTAMSIGHRAVERLQKNEEVARSNHEAQTEIRSILATIAADDADLIHAGQTVDDTYAAYQSSFATTLQTYGRWHDAVEDTLRKAGERAKSEAAGLATRIEDIEKQLTPKSSSSGGAVVVGGERGAEIRRRQEQKRVRLRDEASQLQALRTARREALERIRALLDRELAAEASAPPRAERTK